MASEDKLGASADADRATQAPPRAPAGLGHTVSVPSAGDVFTVAYPFVREAFGMDRTSSWRPGIEYRSDETSYYSHEEGPETHPYADGEGFQVLTVVWTFKPGNFPLRVCFTRRWIAPNGREFGKNRLHIVTLEKFRRLTRGYGLGTGLALEGPYRLAQGIEAGTAETPQEVPCGAREPGGEAMRPTESSS